MTRRTLPLVLFVTMLWLGGPAAAAPRPQPVRYDGHVVARVMIGGPDDVATLRAIGARLLSEAEGVGPVEYVLSPDQLLALGEAGIPHTVVLENLGALIDAERQRLAAGGAVLGGWFADFKDLDAINTKLADLVTQRPDLATPFVVGQSLEGRDINGIRISTAPAGAPAVLIDACQHAREWIAPMTAMYVADRLINDYDTDPAVQDLVDQVEWLIIPVVNPDGYLYTWGPDRLWRKNRRDNGDGTFGVDLNRNWDYGWGLDSGSDPFPGGETYRGPSAFSEPETQVMRDFYTSNPQIVASMDFHSYGQLVLYPWGYTFETSPHEQLHHDLGAVMAASILAVHGAIYTNQAGHDLYLVSGGSFDWTYADQGVFSYTIELRPVGSPFFELPPSQILPTVEENFPAMLDLAAFTLGPPVFTYPAGLPQIIEAETTNGVSVHITPVASALSAGTAELYARVGTTGPFTPSGLTQLPIPGTLFSGALPAAPCGDVVQYYFEVDTDDGGTYRSPDDAPASFFEGEAFDIDVAFADDFEADLGWAVADDPALVEGTWDRGAPVGGGDRGDPPADADGSGQCYLTDNTDGNSDVDGGTTTLTSPVMDASDPGARIAYYRWYSNDFGAAPNEDTFDVEVSDDDGASWTSLETVGPAGPEASGGWVYKEFLISDITGIANGSQFRIRFHASDLGSGSVVEAAVDGVEVKSVGCDQAACPWDCDGSGDGLVGVDDFLAILAQWGQSATSCHFAGGSAVGIDEFLDVLAHWGSCP